MKLLLAILAASEALTGVALLVVPALVVELLFAAQIGEAGVVMSRLVGVALIALGVACWPGGAPNRRAVSGMLAYSTLAALYLAYVGFAREFAGILLWPAVVVHAVLGAILAAHLYKTRDARV